MKRSGLLSHFVVCVALVALLYAYGVLLMRFVGPDWLRLALFVVGAMLFARLSMNSYVRYLKGQSR